MSFIPEHTLSIAKRDFLDVRRSKLAWLPAILYTFSMTVLWILNPVENFNEALIVIAGVSGILLIPLVALVAAYLSIAGELESGTIKFTLGQPVDRSAVVLGKFISRMLVVVIGLLLAFSLSIGAARVLLPEVVFAYADYAMFALFTILYAVVYVSIGVGVSAATSSRSRAIGGGIGVFVLLNMLWETAAGPPRVFRLGLEKLGRDPANFQNVISFVELLSPSGAYVHGLSLFISEAPETANLSGQASSGLATAPWFLQGWVTVVLLASWVVFPLIVGYSSFRHADLG